MEKRPFAMSYGISILFRSIPLAMAAFCFAYGACIVAAGDDPSRMTAGPAVFFLGSVCMALYCMAATIVRRIIGTFTETARYLLPVVGYAFAAATLVCGLLILQSAAPGAVVTGHVVCGLGLVAACVSTAATSSTKFGRIPRSSAAADGAAGPEGFSKGGAWLLIGIAVFFALAAWAWAAILLATGRSTDRLVAGSAMLGIACVCTSFVALAAGIVRQVRGAYTLRERGKWIALVLTAGGAAFVFGLILLFAHRGEAVGFTGIVLIGLALVCWSVSSGVILLAERWHAPFPPVGRIPILPVLTALICLFLGAFLYEAALCDPGFFAPSRVLTGFGAVCFSLFPIVSILESGASKRP